MGWNPDAANAVLTGHVGTPLFPTIPSSTAPHEKRLLEFLLHGEYAQVLAEPLARKIFLEGDITSFGAPHVARSHLELASDADRPAVASAVLAIGAAALSLFVHANWTGAPVSQAGGHHLLAARCEVAQSALECDGEVAYALLETPRLLCAARVLLVDMLEDLLPLQPLAVHAQRGSNARSRHSLLPAPCLPHTLLSDSSDV